MGEYNNNRRQGYCPNYSQQFDVYGNGWAYVPTPGVMPNQYIPELAGNQPSVPQVQPSMVANSHSNMLPQGQHQYVTTTGLVQGAYNQSPVLMPTIVGFQPQGYYYSPQSPHLGAAYVNYPSNYGNEEYNGASGLSTFQGGYSMPVMQQPPYVPYNVGSRSESANMPNPHQLAVSSVSQSQGDYPNTSSEDNNFVYEDDSFPPEFIPRYKYTLPPIDNSFQNDEEIKKKSRNLHIQTMPNESDLLPAGLLSPSLDSRSKSTISDLEDYAADNDKTTPMNAEDSESCMSHKSGNPPSPLPGYKIFEPNIKYKMFGPKEKHTDSNSGGDSTSENSLLPNPETVFAEKAKDSLQKYKSKPRKGNAEDVPIKSQPPSLMQVAVEPPPGAMKMSLNQAVSVSETQSKGAKPKTPTRRPLKDTTQDVAQSEFVEPQKQSDRGYRSSRGSSRRARQGIQGEVRGRESTQSTSNHARQGVQNDRGRESTQPTSNHARHGAHSDRGRDSTQSTSNHARQGVHSEVRGRESNQPTSSHARQGVHSESRGRESTSNHARQGVHSENRGRESVQSTSSHAQEKSSGRQKVLAQTAAYFNPTQQGGARDGASCTIVEGQGVKSRPPRQEGRRQGSGQQQRNSNRGRKAASNHEDPGVSETAQALSSLTFYNTSSNKASPSLSRKQKKELASGSSDVGTAGTEKPNMASVSRQQVAQLNTSGKASYARKASGPKYKLNQREQLEEQLKKETYECMVCMEKVLTEQPIWSCNMCYHIFHQPCIQKWYEYCLATTEPFIQETWRCPSCQHVGIERPEEYYCFCGKLKYPPWNRFITPHTCGDSCGRRHVRHTMCNHPCVLPCHPGPCPTCQASILRKCPCGKTETRIMCGSPHQFVCDDVCEKVLDCGRHRCTGKCHYGSCNACQQHFTQECHCKKTQRVLACTVKNSPTDSFPCDNICGKRLSCGQHECKAKCHPGECEPCDLLPSKWSNCPCGRISLSELLNEPRTSCTDPIPSCGKLCNKELSCVKGGKHRCQEVCHVGECSCKLKSFVHCLCGQTSREVPCGERDMGFRCTKKCNKKRTCHRHKCLSLCCTSDFHPCPIECKRFLSCGIHKCERLCHVGNCPPCSVLSFEELHCRCGTTVIYPPVPCGTKPPECDQLCNRQHECDHIPMHTCHSNDECPPCCTFTEKWCYGKHEVRKNVPCHQNEISCGKPCGALMPCHRHYCAQVCHKGECVKDNEKCLQKCEKPRALCGHPCNAECHEGDCPDTPCMQMVQVLCQCKNIVMTRTCCTNTQEYKRMTTSVLAQTMADLQQGHSVNITEKLTSTKLMGDCIQILECSAECKIKERNRRMAMALQIKNPDLGQKLMPRYNENMRRWAKRDPKFVQTIHDQLTELVTLAKQSKQKSRSFSFPVMNREKRQFVHEYCEHFGCESVSYDEEPKRNVVATASKDGAWLPSMGIIEVIDRENGIRKVPVPPSQTSSKKPVTAIKTCESKPKTSNGDETYIQVTAKSSAVGNRTYIQVAGRSSAAKSKEN